MLTSGTVTKMFNLNAEIKETEHFIEVCEQRKHELPSDVMRIKVDVPRFAVANIDFDSLTQVLRDRLETLLESRDVLNQAAKTELLGE